MADSETTFPYRRICPVCREGAEVVISTTKYVEWQEGRLVQDAFPELSPAEREILISGVHPACWETLWSDDPDGLGMEAF